MKRKILIGLAGTVLAATGAAGQDNWLVHMSVDNQFDAYLGTASKTSKLVGTGNAWSTVYTIPVTGVQATDYFYVATASDHIGSQGFLGDFTNQTRNLTFDTGNPVWEVFPVGKFLKQIDPSWPTSWPASLMPAQNQVDKALAFAAANPSVWVSPAKFANWDNRAAGNITTWGHRAGINASAEWIWNNKGVGNPFKPGANHDEFLIFRVPGVPAPGSLALLGVGGLVAARRRR